MAVNTSHLLNHTETSDNTEGLPRLPGLISSSTTRFLVDVISCGIQPIPSLLGMLGNVLSLVVLSYQGIKQTTNIILIGLALADLLYVVSSSYRLLECVARQLDTEIAMQIEVQSMLHINKSATIFSLVSRWYTCFMAVERFIVVQYPLKASRILRQNRMIVASVMLWVFAFASCFYFYLIIDVEEAYNPVFNRTELRITYSDFLLQNFHTVAMVDGLVLPVFSRYLPLVVVFLCTCVILRSLRISLLQRRLMTTSVSAAETQQQQITKTLVSICVVFLLTSIPGIIVSLARFFFAEQGFGDVGRYQNIHAVTVTVDLFFTVLNSSVNVVFYVVFNRHFTSTCRQLFGSCGKTSTFSPSTHTDSSNVVRDSRSVQQYTVSREDTGRVGPLHIP